MVGSPALLPMRTNLVRMQWRYTLPRRSMLAASGLAASTSRRSSNAEISATEPLSDGTAPPKRETMRMVGVAKRRWTVTGPLATETRRRWTEPIC